MQAIAPLASSSGIDLLISPTRDAAEIDRALVAVSGEPKSGLIGVRSRISLMAKSKLLKLVSEDKKLTDTRNLNFVFLERIGGAF